MDNLDLEKAVRGQAPPAVKERSSDEVFLAEVNNLIVKAISAGDLDEKERLFAEKEACEQRMRGKQASEKK